MFELNASMTKEAPSSAFRQSNTKDPNETSFYNNNVLLMLFSYFSSLFFFARRLLLLFFRFTLSLTKVLSWKNFSLAESACCLFGSGFWL